MTTVHRPFRRALIPLVLAVGCSVALAACSPPAATTSFSSSGTVRNGGTLTAAAAGSSKDTLDPNFSPGSVMDLLRSQQLFNNLTGLDRNGKLQYLLATSMTSSDDGRVWTMHLRHGVKLHDGSTFGAADVIYTIKRIIAPDSTANSKSLLSFIPEDGIKKSDDETVQITLTDPYGPFAEVWANEYLPMVPVGFNPKRPVGTGPFAYKSFAPGQSSVFTKFSGYWGPKDHVAILKIADFSDDNAAINALKSGQVDIASSIPLAEASTLKASGINLLDSKSDNYITFAMNTTSAPFNDERVRRAFALIADRKQLVENALNGYGTEGNDYIGGLTDCQPAVQQRTQDIAEAKTLLAESGHTDLTVTLATTNGTPGMVESAQVFAQQAKAAGVTVNVRNLEVAGYLANYLKWDFAVDFYGDFYLPGASTTLLLNGSGNAAHWNDSKFEALVAKAFTQTNAAARCTTEKAMKKIENEDGANIVWGYYDVVNAYSSSLHGVKKDVTGHAVQRLSSVWLDR